MNALRLRLRASSASGIRIDLRGVSPASLCNLDPAAASRVEVGHGNGLVALGDLFDVSIDDREAAVPTLTLEGDLRRVDRIGWRLNAGTLRVDGDAGDYVGCGMTGGDLAVSGSAGDFTASEMAGGRLVVEGDCGDFAAASLPGSIDGMRGGALVIRGNAGARLADRMRRGTLLVFGDAGDFAASRMVAGTLAIAGGCGAHLAYGMRRGTVLCLGAHPEASSTFAPTHHDFRVYWSLLRRHLATAGGAFARLPPTIPQRFVGDMAADGQGELLWFD
jgi:formylmethanofuran dehydrogenase subunit C